MKNILKKTCAVLSAAAMTVTCITAMPFAAAAEGETAAERDIQCSHIEFIGGTDSDNAETVKARAFIRDLSGDKTPVSLFCATYDSDNNLIGASVASGMNTVMTTGEYKTEGGVKTIAYVWNKETLSPVTNIATRGKSDVAPTITFDGESFKDYIGEDFSSDKHEYTKILEENMFTQVIKWPEVSVTLDDNSASYKVITDESALTTTVRIFTGDRKITKTDVTGTNTTNTVTREAYDKTYTDYVIKYSISDGVYTSADYAAPTNNNGLVGGQDYLNYKYVKEVTMGEDTVKEVTVNASSFKNQAGIIIVKPKNSSDKNIVVNSDGTDLEWTENDWEDIIDRNSDGTYVYGKRSTTTPVKAEYGTSSANLVVHQALTESDFDGGYASGSPIVTDRRPASGGKQIGSAASDLLGYNYIVPASVGNQSSIKFTFYIKAGAEMIDVAKDAGALSSKDGWTEYSAASDTASDLADEVRASWGTWNKCYLFIHYKNATPPYYAAKLIKENGYAKEDFIKANTITKDSTLKVYDGLNKAYSGTAAMELYVPVKWKDVYDIVDSYGRYPYVPAKWDSSMGKLTTLDDLLWAYRRIDGGTLCANLNVDYNNMTAKVMPQPDTFPLGETGLFVDRDALTSAVRTGTVLNYGDVLELESSDVIKPAIGWVTDQAQYSADYTGLNKTNKDITYVPNADFDGKWYSFTAGGSCEVMLAASGVMGFAEESGSGWIKMHLGDDSGRLEYLTNLSSQTNEKHDYLPIIYIKRFAKGEKVQLYAPKNQTHFMTAVRSLPGEIISDSETTAGISDIQITSPQYDAESGAAILGTDGKLITSVNTSHTAKINTVGKLKLNDGTNLGSRIVYDRGYPQNETYTNDLRTISDKFKGLLGSEYIMSAGQGNERASNGFETSFKLYKDATIVLFAGSSATGNKTKAAELGWSFDETTTANPYMTYQLDSLKNFTQVMTKHFTVSDKINGDTVTIPRELLYDNGVAVNNTNYSTGVSMTVVYYD